ncbi:MAG TPA: chalcone isomerase family protein [Gemmatimonadales bacterium]|nr:chalcone isomerase family protein [Gemmatimonadales bacterium]
MLATMLLIAATALQTSEITEPNTKVAFPAELQTATGAQVLTGTGVRTRTMLKVKVYAFGLYVDAAGARTGLAPWRGKNAADLARDQSLYTELLKGSFPMTLRLVMTRDVGADQMSEAFNDALAPRVAQAEQRGMTGGAEALTQFRAFFTDRLTEGTELVFSRSSGKLTVTIGGKQAGEIDNAALAWALFDVYLGEKPISSDGKKGVVARVPELLGA